ncbi:MAG: ATP-binding cassette domain-containing protein [Rhodobacteraceae bacterium]|nr:ATP-binding cassette domain-containing protein [Paracoccaceae bacterium]
MTLATNGKSVIYVSHRLDEIFKICHRITVLRDGISQEPRKVSEFNVHSLVESMLGRELQNMFPERMKLTRSEPLLEVCGLWSDATVEPFNFQVYPGEILGLAGQLGSGSGDILSAIGGASGTREGKIKYKGREFLPKSPKEAIKASIAYCSNDRKLDGLFLGRPIKENLTSPALGRISTYGLLNQGSEERLAFGNAEKFTVDVTRMGTEAGLLSGGNQQKVALGKWLSIEPNIILVNEPTRGVDVGARAEIYGKLREFANEGKAVIFASTDIQEITGLSDRIITFYRGMQIGEIELKDISATKVLEQITHPFGVQQEVKTA